MFDICCVSPLYLLATQIWLSYIKEKLFKLLTSWLLELQYIITLVLIELGNFHSPRGGNCYRNSHLMVKENMKKMLLLVSDELMDSIRKHPHSKRLPLCLCVGLARALFDTYMIWTSWLRVNTAKTGWPIFGHNVNNPACWDIITVEIMKSHACRYSWKRFQSITQVI